MTPKEKIKASKYMSLLLRHKPEVANLTLDDKGYVRTTDLLKALKERFAGVSLTILREIVAEDEKQRYSFNDEFYQKIRANQGHSLDVDLALAPAVPPEMLYHGTAMKTLPLIRCSGLLSMGRQYVHLSDNVDTARIVGKRHGDPTVLQVLTGEMVRDCMEFFKSENGIWLTNRVPPEYLVFEDEWAS